jgi:hypothetical protein
MFAQVTMSSLLIAQRLPEVNVRRPTVIAFFAPVTQEELSKDADTNEALADFQAYAKSVRRPLKDAGIDYKELYTHAFRVRTGYRVSNFHPAKDVGYFLIAPGKKPRVQYGVMTDGDLLEVATEYFGSSLK